MTLDALLETLRAEFGPAVRGTTSPAAGRLLADIDRLRLRDAARRLVLLGGRYQVGVGYDDRDKTGTYGLIHLFAFDRDRYSIGLRTSAPADDPVFDSITPDIPAAGWTEREYRDLLGLTFTGHPKPKKLVTADDWPDGIFPLRKEVPYNLVPPSAEDVAYQLDEAPPGTTIVPVGPFHSTLHEPAHFAVYVDGETIKGCDYRGFMTHRGIEKLCESQVSYNEVPFIAERICGICGSVHSVAYCQAVEQAAGLPISRRAEFIRVVCLELERLHSHLLLLGVAGHLIGFDTIFMHAWRIREQIMWLSERVTGNRKTYGMVVIGGVRRDITPEVAEDMRSVLNNLETEIAAFEKAVVKDSSIHRRTKGVGHVPTEEIVLWSLLGPVARGRGVDIDARRDHPYAAYDEMTFAVPVVGDGDVWGTIVVRLAELFESIKIVRQALDRMPDGPILTEYGETLPAFRSGWSMVEAPRGESVHFVITGEENRPERWRVRAPTYTNLQGVPRMLLDNQFADFPIIVGSIDPCFSCTDRVAVLDGRSGRKRFLDRSELDRMSRAGRDGRG
jgi:Ni,Fe-hydrogenase III large subunit/Ni,Fe-hydrogenase III component G